VPLRTPLCDLLGIEVPIFNVGFGDAAMPELAAAVSEAGGCGVIGCSSIPAAAVRARIARTRELTARPFGVNVIIAGLADPEAAPLVEERIAAAVGERVPVLVLFWGDPAPFVEAAHANAVRVLIQVGSVEEAVAAAEAGVDAVIAQGSEAGGHVKSETALGTIVPAVVDAVAPVPVIAAGGIADGRGIAAALALGAQGVSLGTRFVACAEAWVTEEYRQRVVAAGAGDLFYGDLFDNGWLKAPHRCLRNRSVEEWEAAGRPPRGERPGEGEVIGVLHREEGDFEVERYSPIMLTPGFEGRSEHVPMWAGESAELVHDVKPAAEIVRELAAEAEAALYSVTTYSNEAQQISVKTTS